MYACAAARYIQAYCQVTFKNAANMESTVVQGSQLDCFDIIDTGSHKYIPTEWLNTQLNLPQGAGVFNYVKFSDKSYLLLTCGGRVAYWSGSKDDQPKFNPELRRELI